MVKDIKSIPSFDGQGFKGRPYLHNPLEEYFVKNKEGELVEVRGHQYAYIFIWIGITPKGKESKYFSWMKTSSIDEQKIVEHLNKPGPYLPKGYHWKGPFLYQRALPAKEIERRICEGIQDT